jgi:hypothetical protein
MKQKAKSQLMSMVSVLCKRAIEELIEIYDIVGSKFHICTWTRPGVYIWPM